MLRERSHEIVGLQRGEDARDAHVLREVIHGAIDDAGARVVADDQRELGAVQTRRTVVRAVQLLDGKPEWIHGEALGGARGVQTRERAEEHRVVVFGISLHEKALFGTQRHARAFSAASGSRDLARAIGVRGALAGASRPRDAARVARAASGAPRLAAVVAATSRGDGAATTAVSSVARASRLRRGLFVLSQRRDEQTPGHRGRDERAGAGPLLGEEARHRVLEAPREMGDGTVRKS
jgi:hypothetical protein